MDTHVAFIDEVMSRDGVVGAGRLAEVLRITKKELAVTVGLSFDAVSKRRRAGGRATQTRLRDTVEILNRVSDWSGSPGRAFAWFRSQPLPSFGDKTVEDLLKEGRAEDVKAYLSRIAEGGYA
jgi:hypothetical protein